MGLDNRRPPLPAPTETSNDEDTDANTQFTGRSTYVPDDGISLPPDGRPITISTQKITAAREGGIGRHGRNKSQTSLLIEYFEASKSSDKSRSRPSVRVKVTPSAHKKSRSGNEAIQITGIGSDRKPSYTRRISLGNFNNSKPVEGGAAPTDGTEISHSSDSNVSSRPPLEIEFLNSGSDISAHRSSRGLSYAPIESNVSSMPPDSMLDGETYNDSEVSRGMEGGIGSQSTETTYLKAPVRTGSQNRSDSRERITQKVMEKLASSSSKPRKSSQTGHRRSYSGTKEYDGETHEGRRKVSRSQRFDEDTVSGAESSLLSSQVAGSEKSYRSGNSQASRMTNNPKLLEMVEDTIKRMILPEINAIKEDQKTDRKLRNVRDSRRGSVQSEDEQYAGSPKLASKPKVVLNRDGDDPGVVLSRGDSERVKHRRPSRDGHSEKLHSSSRRSSGHSRRESYEDEEKLRPRSSKSSSGPRGAAAAGLAGGVLTAAALRHHDSNGDMHERRKKRSKSRSSRSRSASITEKGHGTYSKTTIPPMPLGSNINDSDMTRESLLSRGTEQPHSAASPGPSSPHGLSRASQDSSASPTSSRTLTGLSKGLGMSHSNHSIDSPKSPSGGVSNKTRVAALAAAGLGGVAVAKGGADRHMDADGYGSPTTHRKISSPVHSISSLKKNFEDEEPLFPQALRPRTPVSRSSADHLHNEKHSQPSLRPVGSSPTTKLGHSRQQSHDGGLDNLSTPTSPGYVRESLSPGAENADEWYEQQHLVNDSYRNSMGATTNRDSYQTNPYPQDEKRYTMNTDESYDLRMDDAEHDGDKDVRDVGQNLNYVHTPMGIESAVASLMEPSTISSNMLSANDSPGRSNGTYSDRMAEQLRAMGNEKPAVYEGSTLSQTMPSQDRWAAIKGQAVRSVENVASPRQSPARSIHQNGKYDSKPMMVASGLPLANDPMPEIGHYDSQSDLTTNPSIIHGPLGGDATGKDTWPYTPDPPADATNRNVRSARSGQGKGDAVLATAAVTGSAAALAAVHAARQPTVQIDREGTPTGNFPGFRDEGYVTDGRARSAGGITPRPDQVYGKKGMEKYERAMDAHDLGSEDPFAPAQHARNFSGNSHGMASPLYDSSTGKGLDRIQSHDIVALMDHLTVRDAQRNARDTEILVTLVRSAAEMRQSFDEIKKFITEQDKLIMQTTDRNAEYTAQKVLSGPRPQPLGSPRTPRRVTESEEDVQTKRKGVLRRALKGLTGGKSAKDLARIEDMLIQVLDNVEDLKHQSGGRPQLERSYTEDSLDSYEKLRAAPDSGYEPEGQAGTSSTPSHSGHFAAAPREKQQFHSGYDGRRGSDNRVSTVAEDEEDELEPHEHLVLSHQFENNERLLTPTYELNRTRGVSPSQTPPQHAATFNTPEKQSKHKSNGSSLFGVPVPKISRWSKTTASSAAPDPAALDSPNQARNLRPSSEASRSGSAMDQYEDDQFSVSNDDGLRSTQSLAREQGRAAPAETRSTQSVRSQGSRLTRTPSPLIPSEAPTHGQYDYYADERAASPVQEDDEALFDDPKYQAHRNSLPLQHPQPRQGPTPRHQNALETQAQTFDDHAGTNSDISQRTVSDFDPAVWGSSGTAGLARHRLTHVEPLSPVSMNSPSGYNSRAGSRDGPLVPQQQKQVVSPKVQYEPEPSPEPEIEPQFSNSGFSRDAYSYSSPYGSGHLLEPIPEVRMSLETDSGRLSPDASSAKEAADMRSSGRKITGPRPMSGSSPNAVRIAENTAGSGTVRRKPVPRSQPSIDSLESETF